MKKVFITYGDEKYRQARDFSLWMAEHFGKFDETIAYSPQDIDDDFKKKNECIFSYKRGAGLWLWKPYIINKTLKYVSFGDIVFYCDAGAFIFRNVKHILKSISGSDFWICDLPLAEKFFTKPLCFTKMECNSDDFKETPQRFATFMAIRKSPQTIKLVSEWLLYSQNLELISPEKTDDPFMFHREDQSILSLLTKKYKIDTHYDPSIGGLYPEINYVKEVKPIITYHRREYPLCMVIHKNPKVGFFLIAKEMMKILCPKFLFKIYMKHKLLKFTPPRKLILSNFKLRQDTYKWICCHQTERMVA